MKLYGSLNKRSFNTLKIRAAFAEAGAAFEFEPVDLPGGANKTPEFLALNPHGKIPVLVDGDFALAESDAILWYVAEKHPQAKLLPPAGDLQARARVQQWCAFASTALYSGYIEWSGPNKDAAVKKIERALGVLQTVLAKRAWVAGDFFSIADLANAAIIATLKTKMTAATAATATDPLASFDRVQAWYDRVIARSAWKASVD